MRKRIAVLAVCGMLAVSAAGCSGSMSANGETLGGAEAGQTAAAVPLAGAEQTEDAAQSSGQTNGQQAGTSDSAPDIINNTPTSNPGPGAALDGDGSAEQAGERYVDPQPVKKTGTIKSVDQESGQIVFLSNESYTDENGAVSDSVQEIVFNVADGVPIIDAQTGFPVALGDLKEGEEAYAWTAQMMTMSLPPQTPLQAMVVNLAQDTAAPQYVVVKEAERHEDGSLTFTDQDGNRWNAAEEETVVTPYLTRQMIYLDGIEAGAHCLMYPGPAMTASEPPMYTAEKIVVFNW